MKLPVVLLPALLCNAGLFIHQFRKFEDKADFFVPDLGTDTTVGGTARRILKQAPKHFVLGGISMGGYVAFEILRQAPERVMGLILMDTNAREDPEASRIKRSEMIETAQKKGIEAVIEPALLNIISEKHRKNDVIRHILTHMAKTTGVEKYVNEQKIIMSRPDSSDLLKNITCPVLVMGGKEDVLSPPEMMDAMTAQIPTAFHAIIADSGHLPPLENPAAVNAAWNIFFEKSFSITKSP